uniref:Uncharacterized protein n=1 Tax=Arundo donax TaxID=35708 RepID=A0A0A9FXM4_ARUDO
MCYYVGWLKGVESRHKVNQLTNCSTVQYFSWSMIDLSKILIVYCSHKRKASFQMNKTWYLRQIIWAHMCISKQLVTLYA